MENVGLHNYLKVVVFKIENEEFGLPIDQVVSIERMQQITTVPKTPAYVRGITTIRGIVTPVIDLRLVMDANVSENESARLIIVKMNEQSIGLAVDAASDVMDIPTESIQQPSFSSIDTNYLIGISHLNNRLILLINTKYLLENLENFQKIKNIVQHHK